MPTNTTPKRRNGMGRTGGWAALLVATIALAATVGPVTPAGAAGQGAADRKIAATGVVTKPDLPMLWSPQDYDRNQALADLAKKVPACKQYRKYLALGARGATASSGTFALGDAEIQNTTTVYPTDAAATQALAGLQSADVPACFTALFQRFYSTLYSPKSRPAPTQADVKAVTTSTVGDQSTAFAGNATITSRDGNVSTIAIANLVSRFGRVISSYLVLTDDASKSDAQMALGQALLSTGGRIRLAQS